MIASGSPPMPDCIVAPSGMRSSMVAMNASEMRRHAARVIERFCAVGREFDENIEGVDRVGVTALGAGWFASTRPMTTASSGGPVTSFVVVGDSRAW